MQGVSGIFLREIREDPETCPVYDKRASVSLYRRHHATEQDAAGMPEKKEGSKEYPEFIIRTKQE